MAQCSVPRCALQNSTWQRSFNQSTQQALATCVQLACREAETVVLRLRVLRAKLLADTYSDECLVSLQHAREALTSRLGDTAATLRKVCLNTQEIPYTQQSLRQARAKLRAYEDAGPALAALATQYRALCQEVQHAQYSLEEVLGGLHAELKA